jgi:hypothetical protein
MYCKELQLYFNRLKITMHRSAITPSLILIGTLIILVHFTSITFPNVKAQEYI